jgi:hypothetical protein
MGNIKRFGCDKKRVRFITKKSNEEITKDAPYKWEDNTKINFGFMWCTLKSNG